MNDRAAEIDRLRRSRPRSLLVRWSVAALAALILYSWLCGEVEVSDLLQARRVGDLAGFIGQELVPLPLRDREFEWRILRDWAGGILESRGGTALGATLAISVLAAVLAGLAGLAFCLPAARTWMNAEPFLPSGRGAEWPRRLVTGAVVRGTRGLLLFLRAIPEFVWAYLFLAMLGPSAWPAVLALAVHNAGIIGKLDAEVVENLDPSALRALRGLGARRTQIAAAAVFPLALPRFLLYFFYRFETCVREATILGMTGIVSLGYWIRETRASRYYDEMFFFVLLGAVLVLAADVGSAVARRIVRKAA